jgi:cytochrome P450
LARTEMKVVFEELTHRLPHIRLVEGQQFHYSPSISFRGVESVQVCWDPAQNPVPADRP